MKVKIILLCILPIIFLASVGAQDYNCNPYGDGSPRKIGDANADKVIDVKDARAIFEYAVDESVFEGAVGCMDVNDDGIVNLDDMQIVNKNIDDGTEPEGVYVLPGSGEENDAGSRIFGGQPKADEEEDEEIPDIKPAKPASLFDKTKEFKENSPVLFWVIIVVLILLILFVSGLIIYFIIKMKRGDAGNLSPGGSNVGVRFNQGNKSARFSGGLN